MEGLCCGRDGVTSLKKVRLHKEGQYGYCASCGKLVIERDWYQIGAYRLDGNRCKSCGASVAGRFSAEGAGAWGRRRMRVAIA